MTTPMVIEGALSKPVYPAAVAGQTPSAVYKLGQVLKEIVHGIPAAFAGENDVLAAITAIDEFIKAFVPAAALPALLTGDERASVEDVSKRIPPQGVAYVVPSNVPVIDYDKLAMAMVRAQQELAASAPAPATDTVTDEENA